MQLLLIRGDRDRPTTGLSITGGHLKHVTALRDALSKCMTKAIEGADLLLVQLLDKLQFVVSEVAIGDEMNEEEFLDALAKHYDPLVGMVGCVIAREKDARRALETTRLRAQQAFQAVEKVSDESDKVSVEVDTTSGEYETTLDEVDTTSGEYETTLDDNAKAERDVRVKRLKDVLLKLKPLEPIDKSLNVWHGLRKAGDYRRPEFNKLRHNLLLPSLKEVSSPEQRELLEALLLDFCVKNELNPYDLFRLGLFDNNHTFLGGMRSKNRPFFIASLRDYELLRFVKYAYHCCVAHCDGYDIQHLTDTENAPNRWPLLIIYPCLLRTLNDYEVKNITAFKEYAKKYGKEAHATIYSRVRIDGTILSSYRLVEHQKLVELIDLLKRYSVDRGHDPALESAASEESEESEEGEESKESTPSDEEEQDATDERHISTAASVHECVEVMNTLLNAQIEGVNPEDERWNMIIPTLMRFFELLELDVAWLTYWFQGGDVASNGKPITEAIVYQISERQRKELYGDITAMNELFSNEVSPGAKTLREMLTRLSTNVFPMDLIRVKLPTIVYMDQRPTLRRITADVKAGEHKYMARSRFNKLVELLGG